MKYLKTKIFIITLILSTSFSFAQSGTKDGTFEAANLDEFFIEVNSGIDIEIEGTETDQISYTYSFKGNAQAYKRYFEGFNPRFEKEAGIADLEIEYPKEKAKNISYEIDLNLLKLKIPEQVRLHLATEYSTISIKNIGRDVLVYNRSGSVAVEDIDQSVEVNNEYGDIRVRNVGGQTRINGRSSAIDVNNITGMVSIRGSYSKVNASKIDGDVDIQNKSGVINAFDIRGDLNAEADYTEFEVTNIEGRVNIRSQSGEVYAENVLGFNFSGDYTNVRANDIKNAGSVAIKGRSAEIEVSNIESQISISGEYMNVRASNINQRFSVTNRSGTVRAQNIEDSFDFTGEYTDVDLTKFKGNDLRIRSKSGNVSVGALSESLNADIRTEYGNIKLTVPNSFKGGFEAMATYGDLDHNLNLSDRQMLNENNEKKITGVAGNSAENYPNSLFLQVRNGDISVDAN